QGKAVTGDGVSLAVPLEGPPTVEIGAFVEAPQRMLRVGQSWEVADEGRPPRTWRVAGTELVDNTTCPKLERRQQADDCDQPRGARASWRRRDPVGLAPALGIAVRVERVIEGREPLRKEPTQKAVLRYALESRFTYPGQLYEDRCREIELARKLAAEAAPLMR